MGKDCLFQCLHSSTHKSTVAIQTLKAIIIILLKVSCEIVCVINAPEVYPWQQEGQECPGGHQTQAVTLGDCPVQDQGFDLKFFVGLFQLDRFCENREINLKKKK